MAKVTGNRIRVRVGSGLRAGVREELYCFNKLEFKL